MYKFKSDLLNEELSNHNLSFCKDSNIIKFHEMLNEIEGKSVMVRVFPHEEKHIDDYFYDRKLKNQMTYHLKREGFRYTAFNNFVGYYIKEL